MINSVLSLLKDTLMATSWAFEDRRPSSTHMALMDHENALTLKAINDCLYSNVSEDQLEKNIKKLLADRWERIRNTPLDYTHNPDNIINRLCIELANALEPLPKTPEEIDELKAGYGPYFLLMPSLEAGIDIAGRNIHQLQLHQFILSDDERLPIPLQDCLDYAVTQELKHIVCKNPDEPDYPLLSSNEVERIANHSAAVRNYLHVLVGLWKEKKEGVGLGIQLGKLIEALRKGGKKRAELLATGNVQIPEGESGETLRKRAGDEYNAGAEANEGIMAFSTYWNQFTPEQLEQFDQQYPNFEINGARHDGLINLVGRLLRPASDDYKNEIFCVDLIADGFELLAEHYHIASLTLSELEESCRAKSAELEIALADFEKHPLLPSKAKFSKILALVFQLPIEKQRIIFRHSESSDALMYALEHNLDALESLAPLLTVRDKNKAIQQRFMSSGRSSLILAAQEGCVSAMKQLWAWGANINDVDQDGNTALMVAAVNGKTEAVALLLEKGASIHLVNSLGNFSALMLAVAHGHQSVVQLLLDNNADLINRNQEQQTVMDVAIQYHPDLLGPLLLKASTLRPEMQKILLKSAQPHHFETVLSYAAAVKPPLFSALLRKAIELDKDYLEKTSHRVEIAPGRACNISTLELAVLYLKDEEIQEVLDRGATKEALHRALIFAVDHGKRSAADLLIKRGATSGETDNEVNTLLIRAIQNQQHAMIDWLFEKYPNINLDVADHTGKTAIQWAAEQNDSRVVEQLLEKGARIDLFGYPGKEKVYWVDTHSTMVTTLKQRNIIIEHQKGLTPDVKASLRYRENEIFFDLRENNLYLKSDNELDRILAAIPKQVTEVALDGTGFLKIEHLDNSDIFFLHRMNFNKHIATMKSIEQQMRTKTKKLLNRKSSYNAAANSAQTLCKQLESARETFLLDHKKEVFIQSCEMAIASASELKNHRGFKKAIADFIHDLLGLFSQKAVIAIQNKYGFFNPRTESHKKLDELSQGVAIAKNKLNLG